MTNSIIYISPKFHIISPKDRGVMNISLPIGLWTLGQAAPTLEGAPVVTTQMEGGKDDV